MPCLRVVKPLNVGKVATVQLLGHHQLPAVGGTQARDFAA